MVYLRAIADRRKKEWGSGNDDPTDVELIEILELIEKVKQEKANESHQTDNGNEV